MSDRLEGTQRTEALAALVTSDALRARLGLAARQRYEALYTPAHMARSVQALYGQIAP